MGRQREVVPEHLIGAVDQEDPQAHGRHRRRSTTSTPCPRPSPLTATPAPRRVLKWYVRSMSGTYQVVVGDRGRMVVPAEVRERAGITEGTVLVLLDTPNGLVLLTRDQLRDRVRADLAGTDLVGALLAERRANALADDAA